MGEMTPAGALKQDPLKIRETGMPGSPADSGLVEEMLVTAVDGRYAGDVSPKEAFELLCGEASAALIDVRTRAEWTFVGVADLATCSKAPLLVEWQCYPTMEINETFVVDVEKALDDGGANKTGTLLFLCRSGVRSIAAAEMMTAAGYTQSFNVTEGFEGSLDVEGHRGVGGWKAQGLPWVQR